MFQVCFNEICRRSAVFRLLLAEIIIGVTLWERGGRTHHRGGKKNCSLKNFVVSEDLPFPFSHGVYEYRG